MKKILAVIGLAMAFFSNAQHAYEKGTIIDSIPVGASNNETFALYLPQSFNENELSPIVFVFDPAGRGKTGIKPFIPSAETHGYILVCSNNIRNGPYERNFELANRWFTHIFSNFSISEKQMYVAGFSGGSRLASAIAVLTNQMAGVIACGAGLSQHTSHTPSNHDFSYVGLCGNRDMNYLEMTGVQKFLNKLNVNNTLITYEGDHRWPPSEQLLKAFDWLALQSHKKGTKMQSDDFLIRSYRRSWEEAQKNQINKNPLEAAQGYERIIKSYGSLFATDSISTQLTNLKKTKHYKNAEKNREVAFRKEEMLTKTFIERFNQDYKKPQKANHSWWKRELEKIGETSGATNFEMNRMADRVKYKVFAMAYERMQLATPPPSEKQIAFCKAVGNLVFPKEKSGDF
ncbi:hypothetical protein FK220_006730 [Flavobacteriaceae bacterium TP-CH-4]|uniref:Phospholipase/carboxylesterase/thioesterase domain-containing protein n=1 Tax=Pelagihabitans pacificus TaxID=2696054 RepID=A0A967E536_9FLAO|nr:hypothetical protein [Pelagihabitans pacificus]NHF59027.1 hypothetical protein [Pelagihabitans pacificus]